ncbi:MAG: recombination mediator RecR [Desulfobacteraceae bacterium]|nr:recombination mediator RecR [Desulfobacteraceae bacterium]
MSMNANGYPPIVNNLIRRLAKLPGLGEKSAARIAMYLLQAPREEAEGIAEAIRQMRSKVRTCARCFNFTDSELCSFCADPARDTGQICVVEGTADLMAIEQSGAFRGRYHVLQGVLAPLDAVGPGDIRIREFLKRLDEENVREVIIATNPSNEGEATAHYLAKLLKGRDIRISRIAYGVPMGGDVKYVDRVTLERAMKGRQSFD